MDNYHPYLLQQLAPLVKIQFLGNIRDSEVGVNLVNEFDSFDISGKVWDPSILKNRMLNTKYLINYGPIELDKYIRKDKSVAFSPFHPLSDLFPNGILSKNWFNKYIEDIPFVVVHVFQLRDENANSKDSQLSSSGSHKDSDSQSSSDSPLDDSALAAHMSSLKAKYLHAGVNFAAIVISKNPSADEPRIDRLRALTSLPKLHGLLYLSSEEQTLKRDCGVLVASLLSSIKHMASDFYSSLEFKIKQRHKKEYSVPESRADVDTRVTISPPFLEARNLIKQSVIQQFIHPQNLEGSLRLLELAYQNMVDLCAQVFPENSRPLGEVEEKKKPQVEDTEKSQISNTDDDPMSDHDRKLYVQFRTLIDVLGFHIVRGYFSLDVPLTALKKHLTHVENVLSICSLESETNWVSVQYEWLAQLMLLALPTQAVNVDIGKKKKSQVRTTGYAGGIQIFDSFWFNVPSDVPSAFIKAVEYLEKVKQDKHKIEDINSYLFLYKNFDEIEDHIVDLLLQVVKSCENMKTPVGTSNLLQFVYWKLADAYYEKKEFDKAAEFYLKCNVHTALWKHLRTSITEKLLRCHKAEGNKQKQLDAIIELSKLEPTQFDDYSDLVEGQTEKEDEEKEKGAKEDEEKEKGAKEDDEDEEKGAKEDGEDESKRNIDNDSHTQDSRPSLVDVDFLITNPESSVTHAFDNCLMQIVLTNKVDISVLRKYFPNKEVSIVIDELRIIIEEKRKNRREVVVVQGKEGEHASDKKNSPIIELGENRVCNLGLTHSKTLKLTHRFTKSGFFDVVGVEADVKLRIGSFTILRKELHDQLRSSSFYGRIYTENQPDKLVRMDSNHQIGVSLIPPKVSADVKTVPGSIVVGEKLTIPVNVDFSKHEHILYKRVSLAASIKVVNRGEKVDYDDSYLTRVNWNALKDDEPLDISEASVGEQQIHLHVHSVRELAAQESAVTCDIKCHVEEDGDEGEFVFDVGSFTMLLVDVPASVSCDINPRMGHSEDDIPSVFFMTKEEVGLPNVSRFWMAMAHIADIASDIHVEEVNVELKSRNPELLVVPVDEKQTREKYNEETDKKESNEKEPKTDEKESQENESKGEQESGKTNYQLSKDTGNPSKTSHCQRFMTKSKSGYTHRNVVVGITVHIVWRREGGDKNVYEKEMKDVTLPLQDPRVLLETEKTDDGVILHYCLENPTPRIFSFTTEFVPGSWKFSSDDNLLPEKQGIFPVLPFSKHWMRFQVEGESSQELPVLKVFDVQYKVSLPTLAASDEIERRGEGLWLK